MFCRLEFLRLVEVAIARLADLVVRGGGACFHVRQELVGIPKRRLLLKHLDLGMRHKYRVEQSRAGSGETEQEHRRWARIGPRLLTPSTNPFGRDCFGRIRDRASVMRGTLFRHASVVRQ